jgi:hypothetical protein
MIYQMRSPKKQAKYEMIMIPANMTDVIPCKITKNKHPELSYLNLEELSA